eukprot:CAMPEP_0201552086 /NCGR_PEP_ID=MMETSP0173_2-20130828/13603_1 /ASSEMBLY_ACC=CAM_ASM_000268 /TAXON_ID=218659 /ORGANISM="Vexillifera sp., Strain DIVA3 564/2" /LENGTH=320 /DNA_ID=CAMNT_0047962505 /DNA_START=101 /DNA_END=1060 /DNA_ORIENTATION=-
MAKFGEGDPRWIVETRTADAHNLNQWHWTEKTLLPWVKSKVNELFLEQAFNETDEARFVLASVDHVKGDVTCNVRKGKQIVLYEMNIQFKWKAFDKDSGDLLCEGLAHLPYISDENDPDDFQVKFTMTTKETNETFKLKDAGRKAAIAYFKKHIPQLIEELLHSHSTKSNPNLSPTPQVDQNKQQPPAQKQAPVLLAKVGSSGILTRTFKLEVEFYPIPPHELFLCFTDPQRVKAFSGSNSTIKPDVGGEFSFFDGNVHGKVIDIKPKELLVQSWRFKDWPSDHFSMVTMRFSGISNGTKLLLTHEAVPSTDIDRAREGW